MPTLSEVITANAITLESVFVPFSKSRNAGNKDVSLNWRVTLCVNGRAIVTTDYSAGMGHCPSYNKAVPSNWNRPKSDFRPLACAWECENGFEAAIYSWGSDQFQKRKKPRSQEDLEARRPVVFYPILPGVENVVASLTLDSGVLDYPTFEQWAVEYGYDPDSRSGEKTYRACLEIALAMRAGLGERLLSELTEAARDF